MTSGKHFISGIVRQRLGWLTSSVLMVLAASAASPPAAAQSQAPFVQETFQNATLNTANGQNGFWQYGTSNDPNAPIPSDPPCLTAAPLQTNPAVAGTGGIPGCPTNTTGANPNGAPLDPNGQGTLRLTPSKNNQAAFVLYNNPLPTGKGLQITFEFYAYDSSDNPITTGADGINFFLINGNAQPTTAGAFGGSLGYAQRNNPTIVPGIVGGYIGIGLDEYGNYSNPTEGRNGGPGFTPNSIAIRGAEAAGYPYLPRPDGQPYPPLPNGDRLALPTVTTRAPAKRLARVTLTADNRISVDIDLTGTGNNFLNVIALTSLSTIQPNVPLPSTLKFGFASGTGSFTNIHEIRNLVVTAAPPTVTKVHNGNFTIGQNGTYTLSVQNGSATGPVTVTDTLPPGLTFVSSTGTGWSCSAVGQVVTCVSTAAPAANGNFPDITLTVNVTAAAGSQVVNTANVSATPGAGGPTPGGPPPGGTNSPPDIAPISPGPALTPTKSVAVTSSNGNPNGSGSANPGDVLTYTVVIRNSGTLAANGTRFTDAVPANTTYIPSSTRLNNNPVPDAAGNQPFPLTNGTPINSPGGAAGVINVNQAATVTFQVKINQPLPAGVTQIVNQGSVSSNEVTTSIPTNQVVTPIAGLAPDLRLVKRITALIRGGVTTSLNNFVNDPPDPNATAPGFSQLSPVGVSTVGPDTTLQSGDQIEYTIYFLSDGSSPETNVRLCDAVPTGTTFLPDSFGAGQGVLVNRSGTSTPQSNSGGFVSPLAPLPVGNVCADPTNSNGSVLVNLGNISNIPGSNFGFFRFRVRIN